MTKKLAKCKTCEKEVAPTATKCPHCGQKFPAGGAGKGCLVLIAIILVGIFVESMCSVPNNTPSANELSVTYDEFEENFNLFGKSFDTAIQLPDSSKFQPKSNKDGYATRQVLLNEQVALVTTEADNGKLVSVTMIGSGNGGSSDSGFAIIMAMGATMQGVDQTLTKEQRGKILKEVGLTDGRVFKSDKAISTAMNGIKYSATTAPGMGLWFSAEKNI
ncbi:MAG: hypothetical protein ACYDIB_07320 [Desulfobulbia bacterium]